MSIILYITAFLFALYTTWRWSMSKRKCPHCGEEVEEIYFTLCGRKFWNGEKWEDDVVVPKDSEYRASCCDEILMGDDLSRMGVI
jgi:hypothetical protein